MKGLERRQMHQQFIKKKYICFTFYKWQWLYILRISLETFAHHSCLLVKCCFCVVWSSGNHQQYYRPLSKYGKVVSHVDSRINVSICSNHSIFIISFSVVISIIPVSIFKPAIMKHMIRFFIFNHFLPYLVLNRVISFSVEFSCRLLSNNGEPISCIPHFITIGNMFEFNVK